MQIKLTAYFQPASEGEFTCGFEELPDVFSEGETLEEAKANLFDALELVMEYHRDQKQNSNIDDSIIKEVFDLQPA